MNTENFTMKVKQVNCNLVIGKRNVPVAEIAKQTFNDGWVQLHINGQYCLHGFDVEFQSALKLFEGK